MRIGYLGPAGSHSHAAVEAVMQACFLPGTAPFLTPLMGLTPILEAVEESALDVGCIPVENALEGAVGEVLDGLSLHTENTRVLAEFVRPIQHALIRKYPFIEGIQFIHSHPQAIGQCRQALYDLLGPNLKFIPESSTSEAVKVLQHLEESHAALGTLEAASHYGLDVLISNIGDFSHNATRFLLVSTNPNALVSSLPEGSFPLKTSLCLGLHENKPGALLAILTLLAELGINLSKIESRPTKKSLGEYLFYLDMEGSLTPEAEARIREETMFFKCLGTYPCLGVIEGAVPIREPQA